MPGSPPRRDGYLPVDVPSIHHPFVRRFPFFPVIQAQSIVVASAMARRSSVVASRETRKLFVIPFGQPCVFSDLEIRCWLPPPLVQPLRPGSGKKPVGDAAAFASTTEGNDWSQPYRAAVCLRHLSQIILPRGVVRIASWQKSSFL